MIVNRCSALADPTDHPERHMRLTYSFIAINACLSHIELRENAV